MVLTLVLGCGGKSDAAPDGGNARAASSSGGSGGVSASSGGSSGGGSDGGNSGIADGSGASGDGDDDSGGAGSADGTFDGEIPDAFPASCGQFTFALDPDAAPDTCAFTPADVACDTSADCTLYVMVGCGCFQPVYGVNKASTAVCIPPPCVALMCPSDASGGYLTQDCQFADNSPYTRFVAPDGGTTVAVACVNHQCETYAAGSN